TLMTKRRGDVGIMFVAKGEGSVDNAWLMSRDPSSVSTETHSLRHNCCGGRYSMEKQVSME
ncbi:hypothetical protein J6590_104483, partial [Homalodisca vitripennis]